MFRSIQWTLQLWHAGLLALVLVGFGTASYFAISDARIEQWNAELERSVQILASGFRPPELPDKSSTNEGSAQSQPSDSSLVKATSQPTKVTNELADSDPGGALQNLPPLEFDVPASLAEIFAGDQVESSYYVIWDSSGTVLHSSSPDVAAEVTYPGARPEPGSRPRGPGPPQIRKRGEFREAFINGPFGTRILIGTSTRPLQDELRHLSLLLTAIGAGVLVIGLAGGWLVSLRAVRPIREITAVAQDISASDLSHRIPAGDVQSELGSLAVVLNEMFDRLDAAFQQQVRFTADASHELRTPLSVIHTHVQLALSRERSADEYRKTIETCQRSSSRMKDLVDSLLLLAGADAGRLTLKREVINLRTIVESCVAMLTPLAKAKDLVIKADLRDVYLTADESRLAQLITNLLTNAIKYNREKGTVCVTLAADDSEAVLSIADTGLGIPPESQPHIFERFYRVDKARSREEGGSGLGLAICKTITETHGGTITFHSEVGQGTTFVVRLPFESPTGMD